jgi:hypothetical protein
MDSDKKAYLKGWAFFVWDTFAPKANLIEESFCNWDNLPILY